MCETALVETYSESHLPKPERTARLTSSCPSSATLNTTIMSALQGEVECTHESG